METDAFIYTYDIGRGLDVTRSLDLSPGFNNQELQFYAGWRGKDSPRNVNYR